MNRSVSEVFDAALALDEQDRAKLLAKLVQSLDGETDGDAEVAWAAEIEQRLAKIDSGQARALAMDDAIARLHRAVRGQ
jgi:putative addiction module component (TIGR02574 family)